MLTKNEIKYLKSLHQKNERELNKCFICEGEKVVLELLSSGWKLKKLYLTSKLSDNLSLKIDYEILSEKEMDQISGFKTAPGILALVEIPQESLPDFASLQNQTFLILDGINDPGNLGTILRLADWYGISNVFCSPNTVDRFNSKVVQSSMGSVFRTKVFYTDLNEFIKNGLREKIPFFAAVMNGNKAQSGFMKNGGLMMGNESHGISENLLTSEIARVTIPKIGKAESLNVGVATGILLSMIFTD